MLSKAGWREPLKWNREAEAAGERRRVFCASLADVFEDWQGPVLNHRGYRLLACRDCGRMAAEEPCAVCPQCGRKDFSWATLDELRRDLFTLIDDTRWLDWLLLTKRPENVRRMWPARRVAGPGGVGEVCNRLNVWLGTSISDQGTAEEWVPRLLECDGLCPLLFLSAEPLLGPIDLSRYLKLAHHTGHVDDSTCWIDWVIVGGESGHGARPCNIQWIRSIVALCKAAGVPCFVKQLGAEPVNYSGEQLRYLDKKGGDIDTWPADLRVREFPAISAAAS